jgi:hypothetical protein
MNHGGPICYNELMADQQETLKTSFYTVTLPSGETREIPTDIRIEIPVDADVSKEQLNSLAYIPWDEKYVDYVPARYRSFFASVLPFLHARTTDVHTALSVSTVPDLIAGTAEKLDERMVYLAVIVHDSGWGQMSQQEIADSLSYSGLTHSERAKASKKRHTVLGKEMAVKLLDSFVFDPALSQQQKEFISDIVFYHENPLIFTVNGSVPIEARLTCDADRLWSYTHENFWQDTIRKSVDPHTYADNLDEAIETYFFTEQGKAKARSLLAERRQEVAQLPG